MITLSLKDDKLIMRCHYIYRHRCKSIPGAIFDGDIKAWTAPFSSLKDIQREFSDELYYKTPLWKLEGKGEPEKGELKLIGKPVDVPELALEPYEYQEEGIKFMIDRIDNVGFTLNADGVGLGKTIQTIGTMMHYYNKGEAKKILIVCKKSIKHQWASELKRIAFPDKDFPIFVVQGTKPKRKRPDGTFKRREEVYEEMMKLDEGIVIVNYELFKSDIKELTNIGFEFTVIDEAHCVKKRDGSYHNNIAKISRKTKTVLLTGTPVMARIEDLYGIIDLVDEKIFGKFSEFEKEYLVYDNANRRFANYPVGAKNLNKLHKINDRFLIRRTAEDVDISLPEVLPEAFLEAEQDDTQKKMYGVVEKMAENLDKKIRECKNQIELKELVEKEKIFTGLKQYIATDPKAFVELNKEEGISAMFRKMVPKNYKYSNKTMLAVDKVAEIVEAEEKVIIFCQYRSTAKILRQALKDELGIKVAMYTGAQSDEEREKYVNAFKNRDDVPCLIGTGAMSEGLNLQVTRHCIMYETAPTYAEKDQRIGRIRRIGSKYNKVQVYTLYTKDSFDENRIRKVARDKDRYDAVMN